jgi:Leucine-rich repeat (LRR) protein
VNLKRLDLSKNHFTGSLAPLKDMSKLESLDIRDTDISEGLEHLPKSVKNFYCSANERKDYKCKAIYNLFANEKGGIETENYPKRIKNFPRKLQDYKQ